MLGLIVTKNCFASVSHARVQFWNQPVLTCCNSDFEVKCSNFKSSYKWNNNPDFKRLKSIKTLI